MGVVRIMVRELKQVLLAALWAGIIGPTLLGLVSSVKYLRNYPINVKMDQLRMLPLTMGMDVHYLLRKTGYYWEHLLIFLACVYMLILTAETILGRRRKSAPSLKTLGYQMLMCACAPTLALVLTKNAFFLHGFWNGTTSSYFRQLVVVVWSNVGLVAKMRFAIHALTFFKKLERGTFEKEVLLLMITPVVASTILPFLTFASLLLSPLNIEKLEMDQWLYSKEQKGFNEQLVVVLFEWYDVTAINGYFDLNWPCFFGFLASLLWLCSWKDTSRLDDGSFSTVFYANMLKLLCLTAPFLVKAILPKYHYLLWWDNNVDRSGYTFWCTQIYIHLFALISRVRLLQHVFTSFRPQA